MPKKLRNTQIQLAFLEPDFFPAPSSASEAEKPATAENIIAEATPDRPARKRRPPQKMVLITDAEEAPLIHVAEVPPHGGTDTTQGEVTPVPAVEQAANPAQETAPTPELCEASTAQEPAESPHAIKPLPILAASSAGNGNGNGSRFQAGAYIATIVASLTVVITLSVGAYQFIETQKIQRAFLSTQQSTLDQERIAKAAELNSKAVELFLKYNELMLQVNATAAKNAKKETRYWKEHLAVNLLESLFNLTRGNKEWEKTIGWALERHGRFIQNQRLSCDTYSNEFIAYLEKSFGTDAMGMCRSGARSG